MKSRFLILAALALLAPVLAIAETDPLGIDRATGAVNAVTIKIPSGATLEVEAGATLTISGNLDYTDPGDALAALGATTLGENFFTLGNPSAIRFPRVNADNSVSLLNAGDFLTAIGGGSSGVTSVGLSTNLGFLTVASSPITSSGTITINGTTGQTANRVVASPNGSTGAVSLRALVADDLPSIPASKLSGGTATGNYAFSGNVTVGTAGTSITKIAHHWLTGLSFGNLAAGASENINVEVTPASTGDVVAVLYGTSPTLPDGIVVRAWVSAANQVTVQLTNATEAQIDANTSDINVLLIGL